MEFDQIFKSEPVFALSPMANVTNIPFRLVCREGGADMTFTEMVSSHAIAHENARTADMARVLAGESPCAIQIMGPDEDSVRQAIKELEALRETGQTYPDFYDINLGCPSKNILRSKSGAYLLQSPETIEKIVSAANAASGIPISCKARLGLSSDKIEGIARAVEKGGAGMLTVHARTASQGYSGRAKWGTVKKAVGACGLYVLCNGDIRSPQDAKTALEQSGAAGVMIGRRAIENPAIFAECKGAIPAGHGGNEAKKRMFAKYCAHAKEYGIAEVSYARIFATELTRGIKGGAAIRREMNKCEEIECLARIISGLPDQAQ
ncbi:MAG: tRNA-dihydrouridine synthase family protein [Candidatus Micrarchaeia archaeon]